MKKTLMGAWLFQAVGEETFLPANVPGCQFLDLMANGVIPDPFVGVNEQSVQWVHEKDFLYKKTFTLSERELDVEHVDLVFLEIDTVAEVTLNGHLVGKAENCHLPYVFPVKRYVRQGENVLEVVFFSPKKRVEKLYRESPTPPNANGQNGIVHLRKPQCHFGWDWGPNLTPVGLSGDVYLDVYSDKKPIAPLVRVRKQTSGVFTVDVFAENANGVLLTDPNGNIVERSGENVVFTIEKPQIWWTRELSGKDEQPLYTVSAYVLVDGEKAVYATKKIGLRTIALNREKDEYGYNFQFRLNDVPLFIKGANYIPPDSFKTRFTDEKRRALLDAVCFSNMNMIRVWGGGYYADDALLDECDRRGILVWQDFPFACQAYPFFNESFLRNVLAEVESNVNRISSHPCLAIWCGNNEIETMHLGWVTMKKYVDWTEKFFYHILPETIARYDDLTPYTPGSPVGTEHNRNVDADFVGDTHLWGVWHGLQPMTHYRKRMTRFCSEFGFESLPSFRTIRTYADPKDYPLSSAVQKSHQKCVGGNAKMLRYIATRFPLSDDIRDLTYLSQATQATCIADATEHWRRNKGRCNGAMYWQLNDCWPTCSWSGYDYYGSYKALLYAGKQFFAPLSLSIEDGKDTVRVFLLNDLAEEKTVDVECVVFAFDGKKSETTRQTVMIGARENKVVCTLPLARINAQKEGLAVRLYADGKRIQQKTFLRKPEKDIALPKGEIFMKEKTENGQKIVTLSSCVYQRIVYLENDSDKPFSDNFFDLLPGEEKIVTQNDDAPSPLRLTTLTTVRKTNGIKTFFAKIKVYFSARNLANMFYHARIPKQTDASK